MTVRSSEIDKLNAAEKRALLAQLLKQKQQQPKLYPLSFAQQRLYFIEQLEPGSSVYHVPLATRVIGAADPALIERCLNEVVKRHGSLRTVFVEEGDGPVQKVLPQAKLALEPFDLRDVADEARPARLRALLDELFARPFDLANGPLLRAAFVRERDDEAVLFLTVHHIISDGWSAGVLVNELGQLYAAYSLGGAAAPSPLPELAMQYGEAAKAQRERMSGAVLEEQLGYWKKQLGGAPGVLVLGPAKLRAEAPTYAGASVRVEWDGELTRGLRELARREGATLFMALLAGFQTLLARWSGQRDVVVGSPVAGRNRPELEGLIGLFVNTLAMRTDLSGDPSFVEALRRVKETCLGAYAHQEVPFEKLVEELSPERDLRHHPIYQVMFVLQNAPVGRVQLPGVELCAVEIESAASKFDLTLSVEEARDGQGDGGLAATLEYSTELFERAVAERLLAQLEVLLRGAVANPEESIEKLPLLSAAEYAQVVKPWQPMARGGALVHEQVAARAAEQPERVAVVSGETRLTYRQLDERANQLARALQQRGVGRETLVALSLERSEQMVIAVLAVWKAGGAYVPVDPAYPASRIAVMLEISKAPVIVTERWLAQPEWSASAQVLCLGECAEELAAQSTAPLEHQAHEDDLSHVIFTSGSTGTPKGVAICHRSTRKRLEWARERYSDEELGGMLGSTSLSFDLSVYELWGALAHGGKLIVARNVLEYPELPAREEVRLINTVPSAMGELAAVHDLHGVVTVNLAGEALPRELVRTLYRKPTVTKVYNLYGPSEDTTYSTEELVPRDEDGRPAIGRPLPGTWTYIVDGHGQPVPIGVTGELFVAGEGLAREYLHRPDLTSDRFIANRFAPEGERMYKTGDLARYLEDGRIDYQGRVDHQVKIRGFRIELGDIEAALRDQGLREAVVVARAPKAGGPMQLVAYASPAANADTGAAVNPSTVDPSVILAAIAKRLPAYMVPPQLVLLEELPLTPNGKVDRKALPEPSSETSARRTEYLAPIGQTEELLAGVWAELLSLERVSRDDDFFELGGHSLLVMTLASRIERAFGGKPPLRELFEASSLWRMAELVARRLPHLGAPRPPLHPVSREAELPLSYSQQRLWFLEQFEPGTAVYNIPAIVRMHGALDVAALRQSLLALIERHESLRTRFPEIEGQPRQVISRAATLAFEQVSLSSAEVRPRALAEIARPFDLQQGPLLRSLLIEVNDRAGEHALVVTMHHIISDAWSIDVMVREVGELYRAATSGAAPRLPALAVQPADVAVWQRSWMESGELDRQLAYWGEQLAELPQLELPTDHQRPATLSTAGDTVAWQLDSSSVRALAALARREGATPFMAFLALYDVLLARLSGQRDVCVGSPISTRNDAAMEPLIGFFVNSIVLRTKLDDEDSYKSLLGRVRGVTLDAFAHQEVPFERVVEHVQPGRDASRTPLFQSMFSYESAPASALALPGLRLETEASSIAISKFELTLTVSERDGGTFAALEYSADLFTRRTVERFARMFDRLLGAVVSQPGDSVWTLPLLSEADYAQVVKPWQPMVRGGALVHELVAARAAEHPERVAVVSGETRLTYRQLDERANQLARALQQRGVGREVLVALSLERSEQMVIAVLAVWKAGGAYVPVDPAYPASRIAVMLEISKAPVIVTERWLAQPEWSVSAQVLCLGECAEEIAAQSTAPLAHQAHEDDLSHVIFTSGSTGTPKGVAICHRSTRKRLEWARERYSDEELGGMLGSTSLSFDLSVYELWGSLAHGGKLIVARNVLEYPELPAREEVRLINTVPSAMGELAAAHDLRGVITVNLAGEALPRELVRTLYRKPTVTKVYNLYGPSEDTTYSTEELVPRDEEGRPAIGRPLPGTWTYIVDGHGQPVPVGVTGELFVAGEGLAREYLHRPDLTSDRFIANRFAPEGERMYKTGDLARTLEDGRIDYQGRVDHQVKIRGFRIELGDIEAALRDQGLREAVVVARAPKAGGPMQLVAYASPAAPGADRSAWPEPATILAAIAKQLPAYMVPPVLVFLEELPLTPNGKVDRKALPEPSSEASARRTEYVAPATAAEELLAGIWAELLSLERVSRDDDFFELGGHSLLVMTLASRVARAFGEAFGSGPGARPALRDLFEASTLRRMAELLEQRASAARGPGAAPAAPPRPPIVAVGREGALPLSHSQQRLWFLEQFEPGTALYNVPAVVRLRGALDRGALEASLRALVARHESLRARFIAVAGEPRQLISSPDEAALAFTIHPAADEAEAKAFAAAEIARPFDLATGPLLRTALVPIGTCNGSSADEHLLVLTMHHIVSDAWSIDVMVRDVGELYRAHLAHTPPALPALTIGPIDVAVWQDAWMKSGELDRQLAYWTRQLGGQLPQLELPTDRPRPQVLSSAGATHAWQLPADLVDGVRALARRENATPFMAYLALYNALLARLSGPAESGQHDLCVGSPITSRNDAAMEPLIGFFVNSIVLRTQVNEGDSYQRLLARVRDTTLDAFAHGDVPFEKLVERTQPARDPSRTPLFQTMFSYESAPQSSLSLPGLTLTLEDSEISIAKFELTLTLAEREGVTLAALEYSTDLFHASTIARMAAQLEQLARAVLAAPERPLAELPLLTAADERWLDEQAQSGPAAAYAGGWLARFAERVAATPDHPAVEQGGAVLSYAELDQRASELAVQLCRLGVARGQRVGVYLQRRPELIVSLLAVLRAGGAYVPLDPSYPAERLSIMLADAAPRAVLTTRAQVAGLPLCEAIVVEVDAVMARALTAPAASAAEPFVAPQPEDIAYVIYTSGSTGRPKGVEIPHRALANYVAAASSVFELTAADRVLQFSSINFDTSVEEIFCTLGRGATLVLRADDMIDSIPGFIAAAAAARLSVIGMPTAYWHTLVAQLDAPLVAKLRQHARLFVIGGEQALHSALARWGELTAEAAAAAEPRPPLRLLNAYGPTETTISASFADLTAFAASEPEAGTAVPIGRPVAGLFAYVLDGHRRRVPPGVVGELYVGGVGLAAGYLHDEDKTAKSFVADPFRPAADADAGAGEPAARMYKTGDLVRFRADGRLEYMGRADQQVKVRGYRIELGDIEAALTKLPEIAEAAVAAREDERRPGDRRLVAYVVPRDSNHSLSLSTIHAALAGALPEYMHPAALVVLSALPLSPSGKVDRKALPAPELEEAAARELVLPRTELEATVASLFAQVLGLSQVGATDDFFALGGHSLLATQLLSRINSALELELSLRQLFAASSVEQLALVIEEALLAQLEAEVDEGADDGAEAGAADDAALGDDDHG